MKKTSLQCALVLALYYGTNGIYQGYISKYYQQAGISGVPLMLVLAAFPTVAVLMQPVWGLVSDRMQSRNKALRILLIASIALLPAMLISPRFYWLLTITCLLSAFYTAIQPMSDSIILENLQNRSLPFGPVRLCGCVTFAVVNLLVGLFLQGGYQAVPLMTAGGLVLVLAGTLILPDVPGHQSKGKGKRMSLRELLRMPHILPLMGLLMPLQLAMGYFYSYYSIHFTALPGASSTLLGLAYFLSAGSELPFLIFSDKLFKRFGVGRMMLWSALVLTVRFIILGTTRTVGWALISQLCHSGGFIVMTVCMANYVSRTVAPELKSSGQMLLSIFGFGVARVFGVVGGGLISNATGSISAGFLIMAGVCLLSLLCFAPLFLRLPPLNGEAAPQK